MTNQSHAKGAHGESRVILSVCVAGRGTAHRARSTGLGATLVLGKREVRRRTAIRCSAWWDVMRCDEATQTEECATGCFNAPSQTWWLSSHTPTRMAGWLASMTFQPERIGVIVAIDFGSSRINPHHSVHPGGISWNQSWRECLSVCDRPCRLFMCRPWETMGLQVLSSGYFLASGIWIVALSYEVSFDSAWDEWPWGTDQMARLQEGSTFGGA